MTLDDWMRRPAWLLAAARVRSDEALQHPEHSEERRKQMQRAAELEQMAGMER